ncbi:MAG: hypothetical protein V2A54_08250 [Bacteroidota bacterium]
MKSIPIIVFTLFIFSACSKKINSCSYSDGSNNTYTLVIKGAECIFNYIPVTPRESSSGTYSGGSPVQKTISQTEYNEVCNLMISLKEDKTQHISDRVMGSGAVSISRCNREQTFILSSSSEGKKKLEEKLQLIKSK